MDIHELRRRVGSLDQLIYSKRVVMTEGLESGLKLILIDNGNGLSCQLLENRCLDIGKLTYKGINLSFLSKSGYVSPDYSYPIRGEFANYFHGGMLYTCGLRNIGPAATIDNVDYLMHGRLGITPAQLTANVVDIERGEIVVSGIVTESELFGHNLTLSRKITVSLITNEISIADTVSNLGYRSEDIMLLYHFNFGWPMLSEQTTIDINSNIEPRDENARKGLDSWNRFEKPGIPSSEQVFYHTPIAADDHLAHIHVTNPNLKLNVEIAFDPRELPKLIEWKSLACGDYALGIEPSTSLVGGRQREIADKRTLLLAPGEMRTFHVILKITELD